MDRTLLDALLEDAEEHEAAGRVIQAANARAAAENLRALWEPTFEVWAWVGEDEHGTTVGLKQGLVPAGLIPLVSVDLHKLDRGYLREQLQAQVNAFGKPIRLVRLVMVEEADRIERTTWTCPHCGRESWNPNDLAHQWCGACNHFCDDVGLMG